MNDHLLNGPKRRLLQIELLLFVAAIVLCGFHLWAHDAPDRPFRIIGRSQPLLMPDATGSTAQWVNADGCSPDSSADDDDDDDDDDDGLSIELPLRVTAVTTGVRIAADVHCVDLTPPTLLVARAHALRAPPADHLI